MYFSVLHSIVKQLDRSLYSFVRVLVTIDLRPDGTDCAVLCNAGDKAHHNCSASFKSTFTEKYLLCMPLVGVVVLKT